MIDFFLRTLPGLFAVLLRMSAVAALCAAAVILLRAVLNKLGAPRLVVYLLWAVVLFRMVCPVSFESPAALIPAAPLGAGWTDGVSAAPPALDAPNSAPAPSAPLSSGAAAAPEAPSAPAAPVLPSGGREPEKSGPSLMAAAALLWAGGFLALCGWTALSCLRLKRRVRAAVRTADGAWETDRIDGPFVLGFFPPKIYLPLGLEGETRKYVLLHERAHIRHGDHVVKALAFLALAVHWFNPVLWLAWTLACRDMEAVCDESVLRRSGEDIRRGYSAALLALAAARPVRVPLAFGENGVKSRIRGVLRWRRPVALAAAVFALIALALGFMLAADQPPLPDKAPGLTVEFAALDALELSPVLSRWDGEDHAHPAPYLDAQPVAAAEQTVDLRFTGAAPDVVVVTDRLLGGGAQSSQELAVSPYGGGGGLNWLLSLSPHPDSDGEGPELHGITVTARWNSGPRYSTCQYGFQLLTPGRDAEGRSAPFVSVGETYLPLRRGEDLSSVSGLEPVSVPASAVVSVAHPQDGADGYSARLYLRETMEELGQGLNAASAGGGSLPDATGFRLPDGAAGPLALELVYTYPDGHTETWWGLLDAPAGQAPEVDAEVNFDAGKLPALRYPGDAGWTPLLPLLPAPAAWAGDSTAGRDRASTLAGLDGGLAVQAGFTDAREGWAVVSIGTGVGWADVYFYRTHDGGRAWTEYGRPEAAKWYAKLAGFSDAEHGVICVDLFNGAPIFTTADGGRTWDELDVSRIYADVGGSGVPDGSVYLADSLLLRGDWGFVTLECRSGAYPPICLYTTDRWESFAAVGRFCLPAGDEAAYRIIGLERDGDYAALTLALLDGSGAETGRAVLRYDGYAWYREQPIADPAALPADSLPAPLYLDYGDGPRLSTPPSAVYNDPMRVLADLPEAGITLYGLNEAVCGKAGVLLRQGDHLDYYPRVAYLEGPQTVQAGMALGDYDGDGADELAVSVCTGAGTGVSVYELHLFEFQGEGFSQPASLTEEDFRGAVAGSVDSETAVRDGRTLMTLYWQGTKQVCDLTPLARDLDPLWERAVPGYQYHFDLSGVPIRASAALSVYGGGGYIADYSADVAYDGAALSLDWRTGRVEVYGEYKLPE